MAQHCPSTNLYFLMHLLAAFSQSSVLDPRQKHQILPKYYPKFCN